MGGATEQLGGRTSPSGRPPVTSTIEPRAAGWPVARPPPRAAGRRLSRACATRWRAHRVPDPGGDERFRGLYISDVEVDAHLSADAVAPYLRGGATPDSAALARTRVEAAADDAESGGRRHPAAPARRRPSGSTTWTSRCSSSRSRRTSTRGSSGSTPTSTTTCRAGGPAPGWRCSLCGAVAPGPRSARVWTAGAPLVAGGLLVVEDADRPFLTRSLRVPDRVTAHLLGRRRHRRRRSPSWSAVPAGPGRRRRRSWRTRSRRLPPRVHAGAAGRRRAVDGRPGASPRPGCGRSVGRSPAASGRDEDVRECGAIGSRGRRC